MFRRLYGTFILMVLILVCTQGCSSGPDVKSELSRIKAEGAPLTLKELDGPKIPDSINGALVYQQAFNEMKQKGSVKDFDLIKRAFTASYPLKTKDEWKALDRTLAKYNQILPMVEKAQAMSECRFPINYEKKGALGARYPHFAPLRNLSRILFAKAVLSTRNGKTDEAVHYLDLGFKLNDALTYHQSLVAYLVRIVIINTGTSAVKEIIKCNSLPKAHLQHLSNLLANISIVNGASEALKTERAMTISIFDTVREKGPCYLLLDAKELKPFKKTRAHILRCNMDELYYLQHARKYIQATSLSYRDAVKSGRDYDDLPSDTPKYAIVSPLGLFPPASLMKNRDRIQAEINGTRIALALAAYKTNHHAYPAKLNELSKFLGGKVPIDPFAGKPFTYSQQGNGYLLYSIGPDLKDQVGKQPGTDDIVWTTTCK